MTEFCGWTVGETLGAGGMGAVYRATRGAESVALKMIHPGLAADEEFRRRFRREVEISQLLDGAHTAKVIDFDLACETPWLATQLLHGPTVAQAVDRTGPLSDQTLMDLARGTANGLVDLHAAGIVHRDIKPANIILTATGPVLVDFGVAASAEFTAMTATGVRLGSAGWMSPEQVEGRPVTSAADVFSWAVTVAYAATGQNPYGTGPTDALLYRIAHHQPDLSAAPPFWAPILRAALAYRPEDRPTASQLLELARHPDSAAIPTAVATRNARTRTTLGTPHRTEPSTPSIPPRNSQRRQFSGLIATGVALALVLLLSAGAWFVDQREQAPAAGVADNEPAALPSTSADPAPSNPAAEAAPASNRCDVLEGSSSAYPGAPLSIAERNLISPYVLLVQDALNFQRGSFPSLPCVREDGYFGARTEQVVRHYQRLVGLDVDGVVGEDTYAMLMLTFEGRCPADGC